MDKSKFNQKARFSIKEKMKDIMPDLPTEYQVQIIVAILIGFLTVIFVLYKIFGRKSRKDGIVFLGLCESGKTYLVSQLCYKTEVLTVTSVKETSTAYTLKNNKKVLLYDVPGHDRIRYSSFNNVKNQAKALIFVIDAATIQKDLRDVAEFLYNLFCDESVQSGRPSILIACNKQDLVTAKGVAIIKASLEKEINLLRVTQSNQLESVGQKENNNSFLGHVGEDFEFSHLKSSKVSFIECIAKEGNHLEGVQKWIESIA